MSMAAPSISGPEGSREPPLIEVRNLSRRFVKKLDIAAILARKLGANVDESVIHAVDGVNLAIHQGEVVGLAGESGCGKSTIGRVVAGILQPTGGEVRFRGTDVTRLDSQSARKVMLSCQMIFQDPFASLNPRIRVGEIIGEAPRIHKLVPRHEIDDYVDSLLLRVGLDPSCKRRYPHQFSGGQRQRIGIARALAVRPEFLVCDEAVSALDVSIQAQVLNLFMELRADLNLTYLFISHDLSVVEHLSDRVVIMYLGRFVEQAPTESLFRTPNHPYTKALLAEIPRVDQRHRVFSTIRGEIPSPMDPPPGCHFHPRCPDAGQRCKTEAPTLKEIAPGHWSACHLNDAGGVVMPELSERTHRAHSLQSP